MPLTPVAQTFRTAFTSAWVNRVCRVFITAPGSALDRLLGDRAAFLKDPAQNEGNSWHEAVRPDYDPENVERAVRITRDTEYLAAPAAPGEWREYARQLLENTPRVRLGEILSAGGPGVRAWRAEHGFIAP